MSLAPPSQKDGFSYAGDSFYCEASNLNRHRRATLPELQAHFNGEDPVNRPAHWYEAQLLHYGLPPSKVKGTAHKRLFDAVTKGGLTVPTHIQKIEAELKKEWAKRERETKKTLKDASKAKSSTKGTKRKAGEVSTSTNVNVSVNVNVSSTGVVDVQAAQPAAKKAKTAPKATAKDKKVTAAKPAKPSKPTAQTRAPAHQAAQPSSLTSGPSHGEFDDAPPPYSEYEPSSGSGAWGSQQSIPPSSPRRKIGLLNGVYRVSCPYVVRNFPEHEGRLDLIATLDGNTLWLNFNLGVATGVMKVDRPYEVNMDDATRVFWRGNAMQRWTGEYLPYNIDTVKSAGALNRLFFMGDGHIEGTIRFGSKAEDNDVRLDFAADRLPGQSMTSQISPTEARLEWARLDLRGEEWRGAVSLALTRECGCVKGLRRYPKPASGISLIT
ncbi:uncharacterized protein N7459_008238 [Penicillium hispanicum]|uniref:uncharacterized protein n=1 Tax=Penicillium hispanicum TaxID=1080232 RepID=UPI002542476D|nr:uncharacterized protein N7459_008238 [Penicillium hispanicum]KAJ5573811.1 hypothetical protein N7459_008238 [Penicillium hispanicum]